jgi:hypothetical protein
MKQGKSPFKKGVVVAILQGFGHPPRKSKVRKVLTKDGRFVMEDDNRHWVPDWDENAGWFAYVTTDLKKQMWPAWVWNTDAQKQLDQHKRKLAWDKLAEELMHHWSPTASELKAMKAFRNEIIA